MNEFIANMLLEHTEAVNIAAAVAASMIITLVVCITIYVLVIAPINKRADHRRIEKVRQDHSPYYRYYQTNR